MLEHFPVFADHLLDSGRQIEPLRGTANDWSYPALVIVLDSDSPTTAPSLNVQNSSTRLLILPTNGTINGSSILGLDSGQIECHIYSAVRSAGNTPLALFFRMTDTGSTTARGYAVKFFFITTGDNIRIYRLLNSYTLTQISSNILTTKALAAATWF